MEVDLIVSKSNGLLKVTLQVEANLTLDDISVPYELKYNDDRFEIKDPIRGLKLHDGATRWRCKIDGRDIEMFNLDERWWMLG